MNVKHFRSGAAFRRWLERHHASQTEVWVGFYKKGSGRRGITYAEAVDEALCFGWIDGIKKRVDELSYTNRFTPRKRKSAWSAVNVRRLGELMAAGRVTRAGLDAFERRDPKATPHSVATRPRLSPTYERRIKVNAKAWAYFRAQPPGYRRMVGGWIMSAKRETTRRRRLERLITASANGVRLFTAAQNPR